MKIKFIDIKNFRKLKKVRIDFSDDTTLFVGANNSGKTSVITLFKKFFNSVKFSLTDISLDAWKKLEMVGKKILNQEIVSRQDFQDVLIALDIWLSVDENQIHYVADLIPTLDWNGGDLGVRLVLEPDEKNLEQLQRDFREAHKKEEEKKKEYNLIDFLSNKFNYFSIKMYLLDPAKKDLVSQELISEQESVDIELLKKLIQIDVVDATRKVVDSDVKDVMDKKYILSSRISSYYKKYLENVDELSQEDITALEAAHNAEKAYSERFSTKLQSVLKEISHFGYPGLTDSDIVFNSKLSLVDSFKHEGAVQYRVKSSNKTNMSYTLPEQCNGLGYQNLIDIIFQLISIRDSWLNNKQWDFISPIHLVLIEEPEAHLHAQVQQVFIKQAYTLLTHHEIIRNVPSLSTQLVVSTHSSHIAYECDFSQIRYFKREQPADDQVIPTSTVINMSQVFDNNQEETKKFVERYIKAAHCDLFFADAVILVEGSAERILIPYFIRERYKKLNQCYISILEVGGSHAHRLEPLIGQLGLFCLVITDLDAAKGKEKTYPARNCGQKTTNPTLNKWLKKTEIDDLISLTEEKKILKGETGSLVYFCYQQEVDCSEDKFKKIIPSTFEDAVFVENYQFFATIKESRGLVYSFCEAYDKSKDFEDWKKNMLNILKKSGGQKAQFALDILCSIDFSLFHIPTYINDGLAWLEKNLCQ